MKSTILSLFALAVVLALAGCSTKEDSAAASSAPSGSQSASASKESAAGGLGPIASAASYEAGSKKVGDKGVCIVCSVNDGKAGEEEDVKQTLDYEGKTFIFCNESEKADFISDPKKYVSK